MFPKPPGERPDDASSVGDILGWFDKVEALELNPPVSTAIMNRLVLDKVVAKNTFGKELDIPTENQLFDEIAAAGIDISGLATDESFKDKSKHREWWRQSGGIMLTRLSARLASVAAPDPSSQSKDVAAGRALNPSDSSWVGSSSELADFSAALTDDNLTKAMAMLGEAEDSWSDSQKRFALIMRRASIGFTGSELKEKDASPNELRINAVFQKLRSLQGKEIIVLVKNKWHHRVGLMPSFASNLIKVVLKFTDDSSTSSTERLNKAWCEALSTILDMSVTSLRKTEEKSLSKAVSVMVDALRLCLPQVGKEAPTNSVAIIDLWADVDSTFDNYPYPKTGATSGCFDLIQRFIFPVLNEWVAGYWTSVIAGQPVVKTLSSVLEMDALQQSVKTGVGVLAQYASTVRSGLAVAKVAGNPIPDPSQDDSQVSPPATAGAVSGGGIIGKRKKGEFRNPHLNCSGCGRKGHDVQNCFRAKGNEHLRRGTPEYKERSGFW